jgi:hypothetical protein
MNLYFSTSADPAFKIVGNGPLLFFTPLDDPPELLLREPGRGLSLTATAVAIMRLPKSTDDGGT